MNKILKGMWTSLTEMTPFEKWLTAISSGLMVIAAVIGAIYATDYTSAASVLLNVVSPIAAITGIITVVLCARGDYWNYTWGVVNAVSYGAIALYAGLYGDWLVNWFYFLPSQFFILIYWHSHLRYGSERIVRMKKLTVPQLIIGSVGAIAAMVGFGYFLTSVDNWFTQAMRKSSGIYDALTHYTGIKGIGPFFDGTTEILQFLGQFLLVRRLAEQWPVWILVNIGTLLAWLAYLAFDPSSWGWVVPINLMWAAFLVNSFYGAWKWYKEAE